MGFNFDWTPDRIAFVRSRWNEGKSARQIADLIGHGVTRNAVIGIIHRKVLDATPRLNPPAVKRKTNNPYGERARNMRPKPIAGPKIAVPPKPLPPEPPKPPTCQPVALVDLKVNSCRFPLGEVAGAQTMFCGSPREDEAHSYCQFHCGIAYQAFKPHNRWREGPAAKVQQMIEAAP